MVLQVGWESKGGRWIDGVLSEKSRTHLWFAEHTANPKFEKWLNVTGPHGALEIEYGYPIRNATNSKK